MEIDRLSIHICRYIEGVRLQADFTVQNAGKFRIVQVIQDYSGNSGNTGNSGEVTDETGENRA